MATYGRAGKAMLDAWIAGKTFKAMLVSSSYTQDQSHSFRSDVTGEVSGSGYTAGGVTLTGAATTLVDGVAALLFDDITFSGVTLSDVAGIVIYHSTGSASTDTLLAADFFPPEDVTGDDFTYEVPDEGLVTLTAA